MRSVKLSKYPISESEADKKHERPLILARASEAGQMGEGLLRLLGNRAVGQGHDLSPLFRVVRASFKI